MRRLGIVVALAWCCSPAWADLANPATLTIEEISPSSFRVELTLPVVAGRSVKVTPVLPAAAIAAGEPELRGGGRQVVQAWTMECGTPALLGAPIGVEGLLGTALEVQLTVSLLDGRRFTKPLRPRQPLAVLPAPPARARLAWDAGRAGIHRVVGWLELMVLLALATLLSMRPRRIAASILAFGVAYAAGGWLLAEGLLVSSPGVPRLLAACIAAAAAFEVVLGRPWLRPGWHRPLWPALLPVGLLYGGAAGPRSDAVLSRLDARLELVFAALGVTVALALIAVASREIGAATRGLSERVRTRLATAAGYIAGIVACAIGLYEASAPAFGLTLAPETPAVALVAVATLGLWCRTRGGRFGGVLAVAALLLLGGGVALSFSGRQLPLPTLIGVGGLAWLGASLLRAAILPRWIGFAVGAATAVWLGAHAGQLVRETTSLPPAHATGAMAVVAFVLLAGYRASPPVGARLPRIARVCGALALLLAVASRLIEHGHWLAGPVAVDRAMGRLPLPALALGLAVAAALAWPSRRRFRTRSATMPSATHWALLGSAFFLLPYGVLRVPDPWHDRAVPSAATAGRVMNALLTDTYLAFNLADEDEALDRLEQNLAPDLVADVYIDSRRRLRAGTREGSSVTVKEVTVVSVAEGMQATAGNAFTYPCSWIVTARVKHRQHIHDRRNVYVGELTIRVEDDRWQISRLTLKSEAREVLAAWTR